MKGFQMEKVKDHFKKHKTIYLVAATGVTCLTIGLVVGTRQNPEIVQKAIQVGWKNKIQQTVINFEERSTPSKPVKLLGNELRGDQYFDSVSDAARKTGHAISRISKNANGHIPDVNGDVFEFVDLDA
jgi:hypothetical protein